MNRGDAVLAALLAAGLVAWLVPFAPLGVDQHHDGIMLKPALDVLSGQTLFRDTFMQYGALTCYLQVVALWIQPSLLSLRFLTVAAYAVTLFFLYASWHLILPRVLTILACGLFILFIPAYEKNWFGQDWMLLPWSSVYALMFQSISLYALLRMIQGAQAERWALLAGLTCACVSWCRLPVGLVTTAGTGGVWLGLQLAHWAPGNSSQRRVLGCLAGGFAIVHVLMLGQILLTGAGPEWWYQNFVWPFRWSGTVPPTWEKIVTLYLRPDAAGWLAVSLLVTALPFLARRRGYALPAWLSAVYLASLAGIVAWQHERIFPLAALRTGGWTVLLPAMVLGQTLISLALVTRGRHPRTTDFWLVSALAIICTASLAQYYPLPDPWHIIWALGPAFGLALYALWRWLAWPAWVCALVISTAFLPAIHTKWQEAGQALNQPRVTISTPSTLRGMQVPAEMAESMRQIAHTVAAIQKYAPDIPSVLIGTDALYLCFTTNRDNVTPYFVNWPNLGDEQIQQTRWRFISRARPLVFFRGARWDVVNEFYRSYHYVPLLYVPGEAFEIAVPQELADAMGVGVYGAPAPAGSPKPATTKP